MKKRLIDINAAFFALSISSFFLPFIVIEKYKPVTGFTLIINSFQRFELEKTDKFAQDLVYICSSVPLLLSFTAAVSALFLLLYYRKSRKRRLLNAALLTEISALVLYGLQLSSTQTSVADFFGRLLTSYIASDGSRAYRLADIAVFTGIGARLLAVFYPLSLIMIIVIKFKDSLSANCENKIKSPWFAAAMRFKKNKPAVIGLCIICLLVPFCFYGPVFSNHALFETNLAFAKMQPSLDFLLGTDEVGRDIVTRLMYGGRISLTVGFVSVLLQIFIGCTIGGIAGFYGGKIDSILMRLTDIFMSMPFLPIVVLFGAVMSDLDVAPKKRIYAVILTLGLMGWPLLARLVRGQILSLREQEFMLACKALGLSNSRMIFRHQIPNVVPSIIVTATLSIGNAILSESALSFLGLGVSPPYPSWGNIIQAVREPNDFVLRPWLWVAAGLLIIITVLSINFIGDGLNDAVNPKSKINL